MVARNARDFILFVLGQYYREVNRRYKTPVLKVTVSKVEFIALIRKTGFAKKQPRAIYKNLEDLEKERFIAYDHRMLKFTPKGKKEFERMNKYIEPYVNSVEMIKQKKLTKTRSGQMIFYNQGQPRIQ